MQDVINKLQFDCFCFPINREELIEIMIKLHWQSKTVRAGQGSVQNIKY